MRKFNVPPAPDHSRTTSAFSDNSTIGPGGQRNPFATPPASVFGATSAFQHSDTSGGARYFRSRRIRKDDGHEPPKFKKDPKEKWLCIIPLLGVLIGVAITGAMIYLKIGRIVSHQYCSVLDDDFSSGTLNPSIWTAEQEVGGYGNGQFEQTTADAENVFIKDGMLYLKPTLQDESLITANTVINLTASGLCTSDSWSNCVASTNITNGTIIPPVKSARLNTKLGPTIKYGRVEVKAKIPQGDWLWPAIWMMPVTDTYGAWPASGEIDIMESRGNNHTYSLGGNDLVSSALHWGPNPTNDAYRHTTNFKNSLHSEYGDQFHTYGLEWSEKYLFTFVDTRLLQVFYNTFSKPFWNQGGFPYTDANGTRFVDPWSQTGRPQTPFDQEFYLIINVAVGGTNGWFQDGTDGKPWVDASPTAKNDFWNARDQWYPTWTKNGQMIVDRVQMWQQC
ncbi:related to beta-1,3-glucan binding protein [Phialocephala subalpina]|uniref:Related to beta-1,3-glucan binding protein n=1 Tax=Phialocephala subalpina TaxID=576137 RepID=A0A1L7X2B9_9HELO|nr:related to beta-1,3-glucan binding protein [Phialocephala subalpina]